MPRHVLNWPNGNLAVFSTVTDSFLAWDYTEDEVRDFLKDCGEGDHAEEKIERGKADKSFFFPWEDRFAKGDGLSRLRYDLGAMALNRSEEEWRELFGELGLGDEWAEYGKWIWEERNAAPKEESEA